MFARLVYFLKEKRPRAHMPFVVEFLLDPTGILPAKIDLAQYPGLLLLHMVQGSGEARRVLTYWVGQEQFDYAGGQLAGKIGARGQSLVGSVVDARFQTVPFWRKVSAYTLLLAVVGFLSSIKLLADQFDWLFSRPDLVIIGPADGVINAVERVASVETISLSSPLAIAQSDVHVAAYQQISGNTDVTSPISDQTIPNLGAGTSYPLRLPLMLSKTGSYMLRVDATAKAGQLWPREKKQFLIPIKVWSSNPVALLGTSSAISSTGIVDMTISTGRPLAAGVQCDITFSKVPGLSFDGDAGDWATIETAGAEVARLRTKVPGPISRFSAEKLSFSFQARSAVNWKEILKYAEVNCETMMENSK
jgi:hypothetical protein